MEVLSPETQKLAAGVGTEWLEIDRIVTPPKLKNCSLQNGSLDGADTLFGESPGCGMMTKDWRPTAGQNARKERTAPEP